MGFSLIAVSRATLHCIAQASYCSGFFCGGEQAGGHRASVVVACGLDSWRSRALKHRLNSCGEWAELLRGIWDLPGSRITLESPALVGGFFTTATREVPLLGFLWLQDL